MNKTEFELYPHEIDLLRALEIWQSLNYPTISHISKEFWVWLEEDRMGPTKVAAGGTLLEAMQNARKMKENNE